MKKVMAILSAMALLATLDACQDPQAIHSDVKPSTKQPDQVLDEVAWMVTQSIRLDGFKQLVKQEAMKQFDGDYDILLKEFVNQTDVTGRTVKQILITSGALADKSAKTDFQSLLTEVLEKNPLLGISVPMHIEKWNPSTYTPLVVVNAKTSKSSKLKAYKSDGTIVWLDKDVAPTEPFIVIGWNERVELEGSGYRVRKWLDVPANGVVSNKPAPNANARLSGCRTYGQTERLQYYAFHVGQIESFFDGRPELTLYAYQQPNSLASSFFFNPARGDEYTYLGVGSPMFTWQTSSPTVLYIWTETDGGSQIQRYFTENGFNFTFTYGSNDQISYQYASFDACPNSSGFYEYEFNWAQMRTQAF